MHLLTCGSQWVPFGDETARGIHDVFSTIGIVTSVNHLASLEKAIENSHV